MTSSSPEATPPAAARAVRAVRDIRLDLLRGACVALMLYSHLGWPRLAIHFPVGWANAAEWFFLISGVTVGLVARRYDATGRLDELRGRLVLRALWLYGANLLLLAVARWLVVAPHFRPRALARRWRNVPELVEWLSFDQPLALHLLPRYALFVLAAALLLPALRSRWGALVVAAGTASLWLGNFLSDGKLRLPLFETRQPVFPSASWQLLFFAGLVFAFRRGVAPAPRGSPPSRFGAAGWLAAAGTLAFVVAARSGLDRFPELAAVAGNYLQRDLVGPLRLVNAVVVAIFAWRLVGRWREPLEDAVGGLLLPFGRNALPCYLLHLPLIWLGMALPFPGEPVLPRRLFAVAALAAIWLLVRQPIVRKILSPV